MTSNLITVQATDRSIRVLLEWRCLAFCRMRVSGFVCRKTAAWQMWHNTQHHNIFFYFFIYEYDDISFIHTHTPKKKMENKYSEKISVSCNKLFMKKRRRRRSRNSKSNIKWWTTTFDRLVSVRAGASLQNLWIFIWNRFGFILNQSDQ